MKYGKVAVFGTGLIGGAVGRDLIRLGLSEEVCGWGRSSGKLETALRAGACTSVTLDIAEAVTGAGILILAAPPAVNTGLLEKIKPHLSGGMLVMDVGSVKTSIVRKASEIGLGSTGAEFVGCHPMAGSEKTGVENSYPGMFSGSPCIITPSPENSRLMLETARHFWEDLGARVYELDPGEHDRALGMLSHLPHALSSILVSCVFSGIGDIKKIREIAGPSFREMTRIAGSSVELWSDIFLSNSGSVIDSLRIFETSLAEFREALEKGDKARLGKFLSSAAENRSKL